MLTTTQIRVDIKDFIATVVFNRPERMNALTKVVESELRQTLEVLDKDNDVRVIVLTGEGRAFCAGMDMDELETLPPDDIHARDGTRPYNMARRADFQSRYGYFPSLQKPVISAINGAAAGLGIIFALYSDVRLCSERAVFSTAFSRRGLIAEHGIAWILPRVVGISKAMDLLLSARKVSADEALAIGLVDKIYPADALLSEAYKYAAMLATEVSPRSLGIIKRQVWEAQFQTLAEATQMANEEMWESLQSEDFQEGVRHFIEKRRPAFSGR